MSPATIQAEIVRMQMISAPGGLSKRRFEARRLTLAPFFSLLRRTGNFQECSMATSALIVIDVQNDFIPGGALAVGDGHAVVPLINAQMNRFEHVILTQDWHPAHHSSFASNHDGKQPFDSVELHYGAQTLWPNHCVQGSKGAEFHPELDVERCELILRKGFRPQIDSYSAFFENDRTTPTGLAGYLNERGIRTLTMVGLATDYCVAFSALDAVNVGFDTSVHLAACRAIDLDGSMQAMIDMMREAGVRLI
jgi:nicotinamidase/pyrazinamidase